MAPSAMMGDQGMVNNFPKKAALLDPEVFMCELKRNINELQTQDIRIPMQDLKIFEIKCKKIPLSALPGSPPTHVVDLDILILLALLLVVCQNFLLGRCRKPMLPKPGPHCLRFRRPSCTPSPPAYHLLLFRCATPLAKRARICPHNVSVPHPHLELVLNHLQLIFKDHLHKHVCLPIR